MPNKITYIRQLRMLKRYLQDIDMILDRIPQVDPYGDVINNFLDDGFGPRHTTRIIKMINKDLKRQGIRPNPCSYKRNKVFMKEYKGEAWVHPRAGGDDEMYTLKVSAPTKKKARQEVRTFLRKKGSAILTDFTIEEI